VPLKEPAGLRWIPNKVSHNLALTDCWQRDWENCKCGGIFLSALRWNHHPVLSPISPGALAPSHKGREVLTPCDARKKQTISVGRELRVLRITVRYELQQACLLLLGSEVGVLFLVRKYVPDNKRASMVVSIALEDLRFFWSWH